MDIADLTKWACFGDGMMCPVKDRDDNIQRYIKFEDVEELLKHSSSDAGAKCTACGKEAERLYCKRCATPLA